MEPLFTLSRIVHTASLTIAAGSMLALTAPASAGSMTADKDTEINDRPADMRAIYSIEDRAEAIAEGEKSATSRLSPVVNRLRSGLPCERLSRRRARPRKN